MTLQPDKPGVEREPAPPPYRVLNLDGGGVRDVYTAAFLDRLTNQFARTRGEEALDLGKGFDLITDTGRGAIVACALAVGRPQADVVALHRKHGAATFPHQISSKMSAIWRMATGGGRPQHYSFLSSVQHAHVRRQA